MTNHWVMGYALSMRYKPHASVLTEVEPRSINEFSRRRITTPKLGTPVSPSLA